MSELRRPRERWRDWPRWQVALVLSFVLVAGAITYGWETQSGFYAFLPDPAHPAAQVVHVPGEQQPADGSGFYFVDVNVLQANLIQKLWAEHLVDGAALVPDDHILAPGQSNQQRVQQDMRAMTSSQQTAQVVAEQALGKPVQIERLGAQLVAIQNSLPADQAGIKAGDIVTAANGAPVHSAADLIADMKGVKPGQRVRLTLAQAGTETLPTVTSPDLPGRAVIGVSIADAVRVGRIPIHVNFSTGDIGGPSAGLAFALEIYDALSGRHLLRGHRIAVTGELDLGGGVHEIGGVQQKAVGAIDAGADVFIVPAGDNERDARKAAGDRIKVIGVTSFSQALAAIRALPAR
jgi:PDZ domain-containing protein